MVTSIVIVGAGLAGVRTAQGLRREGYEGGIVVVGSEPHLPYDRPPLSKEVLLGNKPETTAQLHDDPWYRDHHIDLRVGRTAVSLDPAAHTVTLDDGTSLPYGQLLIATGSEPRRLTVPGSDLDGVLYLRTLDDERRLQQALEQGGDVVIIGAGWIGLEVAAAARSHGCTVTVIEPQPTPLFGVVGAEIGAVFTRLHEEHQVRFRFGDTVTKITGDTTVTGVHTTQGADLTAAVVVVGVGIVPRTGLAEAAGLEVDNGIVVDATMHTSAEDVFAAGDVAHWMSPVLGESLRVEHWDNAMKTGPLAAKAMLGKDPTNDLVPYFFSDQYDMGLEYTGYVPRGANAEVVVRGDLSSREFVAFWVSDRRVLAGLAMNMWDVMDPIKALITARTQVSIDDLTNPDVAVDSLAG